MEPIEYLRIARRRWVLIVACLVIAVVGALATTPPKTANTGRPIAHFRAEHTLLRAPDAKAEVDLGLTSLFTTTGEVPDRVAKKIDYKGDPAILAENVSAVADDDIGTLRISYTGSDGPEAAKIANAFGDEVIAYLEDTATDTYRRIGADVRKRLSDLKSQILRLDNTVRRSPNNLLVKAERDGLLQQYQLTVQELNRHNEVPPEAGMLTLERATPVPVYQGGFVAPSGRRARTLTAVVIGLLLGCGAALVLERIDVKIRSRATAEKAFGLPVIAEVPRVRRRERTGFAVLTRTRPESAVAEAYRTMRSSLMLMPSQPISRGDEVPQPARAGVVPQVVLVASPGAGTGKTTTVANLAACMAEAGKSVLVLSCDFRKPDVHRYLDVREGHGLSDLLAADLPQELGNVARPSAIPGVRLVVSGTAVDSPAALLARVGTIVKEARRLADVVILDSAPLMSANDATDLMQYVDSVVLVCRVGKTTIEQAVLATEMVARVGAPVVGVGLIASARRPAPYYYDSRTLHRLLGLWRRGSHTSIDDDGASAGAGVGGRISQFWSSR
jgi:Mrp family chromosome partitioning ATPase/capsular polysaccharide biosynthesis protein